MSRKLSPERLSLSLKVTLKVRPMNDGVMQRREKHVEVVGRETGSAKVLKFDRRSGVVLIEKTETASRPRSVLRLVQDLLWLLRHEPRATPSPRRTRATKFR